MKRILFVLAGLVLGLAIRAGETPQVKAVDLMRTEIEVADGIEVMVSRVEVPAGATLAKHYHHGEEFIYVLSGSAKIWRKDLPDVSVKEGEVHKIPSGLIHTAFPGDQGVNALVFRVMEKGKPVRVNAE